MVDAPAPLALAGFTVDPATLSVLVGFFTAVGMTLLQRLLPSGYHFRFMDRLLVKDTEPEPVPDDEEDDDE